MPPITPLTLDQAITTYLLTPGDPSAYPRGPLAVHRGDQATQTLTPTSEFLDIVPLVGGEAFFAAANDDMLSATDTVLIAGWTLDTDVVLPAGTSAPTIALKNLLVNLAAQGVDVRVLLPMFPFVADFVALVAPGLPPGVPAAVPGVFVPDTPFTNVAVARTLRAAQGGAGAPLANNVLLDWSGARIYHMKVIVAQRAVQDAVAYVGGMDLVPNRLDSTHTNFHTHDIACRLRGNIVLDVWNMLATRWQEGLALDSSAGYVQVLNPEIPVPYTTPFNPSNSPLSSFAQPPTDDAILDLVADPPDIQPITAAAQLLRSFPAGACPRPFFASLLKSPKWTVLPTEGIFEIRECLLKAIAAARRYIYVEDQSFCSGIEAWTYAWGMDVLFPALVTAIKTNGVQVMLVTGDYEDSGKVRSEIPYAGWTTDLDEKLITPLGPAPSPPYPPGTGSAGLYVLQNTWVHSKLVMIDDQFGCIGSANFADCSVNALDSEASVGIVSPAGSGNFVTNLRTQIWSAHLGGVDPSGLVDFDSAVNLWTSAPATSGWPNPAGAPNSKVLFKGTWP